jgi:uncharacterized tellurite resistance protein B-like protein
MFVEVLIGVQKKKKKKKKVADPNLAVGQLLMTTLAMAMTIVRHVERRAISPITKKYPAQPTLP